MATAWTKLVTETFKKNRKTNKNYKFKDALVDAKKLYRSSSRSMGTAVVGKVTKTLRKTMKGRGRKYGGADGDANDAAVVPNGSANGSNELRVSETDNKNPIKDINCEQLTTEEEKAACNAAKAKNETIETKINPNSTGSTGELPPKQQTNGVQQDGGRRRKTAKRSKRNTKH